MGPSREKRLSVRTKFILILLLAGALPIFIGLMSIRVLGRRDVERNKGRMFQSTAQHIADSLGLRLYDRVDALEEYVHISELSTLLATLPEPALDSNTYEQQWPAWNADHPQINPFLSNPLAVLLHQFCNRNPLFVEVFVADRQGRLRAATNKTSDYWQADEEWWQRAMALRPGEALVEGIQFDESAAVYSLDIAVPIWTDPSRLDRAGVIKGVVNASPLFGAYQHTILEDHPRVYVVQGDGKILAGLFGEDVPPLEHAIPAATVTQVFGRPSGWLRTPIEGVERDLVGFAPLALEERQSGTSLISGMDPLVIIAYQDMDTVTASIRATLLILSLAGMLFALLFTFAGFYIADRKIIRPLKILRRAARGISESAGLGEDNSLGRAVTPPGQVAASVRQVSDIHTGDEFEELARDFGYMAQRVLRYHEQLEMEISLKTEEIARDQQMARDFQQALLPSQYPRFPDEDAPSIIRLAFHHTYKPTLSVGGDFFDVTKLTPHRAGIFIADVMGHGARSALITAIMRTLLHNLAPTAADPGHLLTLMNKRFYESLPSSQDCIFATACYLIIDTSDGSLHYAYAGHPAPLLCKQETGTVAPLPTTHLCQSALGLLPDTQYTPLRADLQPGDVVVLYTDGVIEAPNPDGEEFGEERLAQVVRDAHHLGADGMTDEIMQALHRFMDTVVSPDDICVVTVEALDVDTM